MKDSSYCSRCNPDEPMLGSADPVDVWVLLEYRPPWSPRAVEEAALSPPVRDWLQQGLAALSAEGLKARPQLVRQPEVESAEVRLLVGTQDALAIVSAAGYGALADVDLLEVVRDPGRYPRLEEPQYFVCTNGQRDLCCARYGLPVYARLRERVGRRAWQTTHLGGHRFAPNVLTLPEGVVYGRVEPEVLDDFVDTVEAGRLALPQLRGRSWYPPPVQAAEGLAGEGLRLEFRHMDGDDAAAAVTFAGPDGERTVRVRRSAEPITVQKSCGDAGMEPVWPYRAG